MIGRRRGGGGPKDGITFNVGGRIFETTSTTLANAGRDSFFGALFDDDWNVLSQSDADADVIFIDRNPEWFGVLLDLLRTGELCVPPHLPQKQLFREARFYGLSDHVRSASWGPLDGNRLRLSSSVRGTAPGDGAAIRGGPDGACCVAHGSIVHVYDWALEERAPLHLDYRIVNDAAWLGPQHIVLSACERPGRGDCGMALFGASDGRLRHRFQVAHDGQPKSFTAGALALGLDRGHVFASCRGRSNEYGVGVWDQSTGQQVDFFYEPLGWSLGDADRLQWLPNSSCLLVATLFPRKDNCYLTLLDFRAKSMVWSWSDHVHVPSADDKRVRDAIAMEDTSSICVVNDLEDLGFMDLRSSAASVRWSSRSRLIIKAAAAATKDNTLPEDEPCYPKLASCNGQLFSSMNDSVSVFSGPDCVFTSSLRSSFGGPICDLSIAGDRLFALHSEENVFDVWEAPPSPLFSL